MNLYQFLLDNPRKAQHIMNANLIREALTITKGNKTLAAELLGISKGTIHNRIKNYNIKHNF